MEQTKSVILPGLIKGLPDGYVLGHGLPPAQQEKNYSLPSLSRRLESTGKHRNLTLQIFATV
jgi:hypothetical protein